MAMTVRQFVRQVYTLINPSNPTQPLKGDDQRFCITIFNQLLNFYAGTGLNLTIADTVTVPVAIGQKYVICGPATYIPTPDITRGRLANVEDAWLLLDGVTYPLIPKSRDEFLASFKYEPLQGLPRLLIVYPQTEITQLQIYPAPSQVFDFYLRAKFQLPMIGPNDTMVLLPDFYIRFFILATAKDTALYSGRADAWTPKLEDELTEAKNIIQAASEVNLSIVGDRASLLNGAWRVRAGI